MRLGTALAFIGVMVTPVLLQSTTCQIRNQSDYVEGQSRVTLTAKALQGGECVTVHVWIKAEDFNNAPKIEIIQSQSKEIIRPTRKNGKKLGHEEVRCKRGVTKQLPHRNTTFALWELVHDCVNASAESTVTVSYSTASTSYSISYTVPEAVPDVQLSVNQLSKSINITVEPGEKVLTRLCYKIDSMCSGGLATTIDPSQSRSALLNISYLLPCLCVQYYYTHSDARRHRKCPFQNKSLIDVQDVWDSSEFTLYESSYTWSSKCSASDLDVSASLCWKQHEHLCTPVLNATLEEKEVDGSIVTYDTSAVDKHPQMCVQFSLKGSHHIECPFEADMSSWEVYMKLGKRSVVVYLTSSVPATFSAQLCVLNEKGCTPTAQVYSVRMEGNTTDKSTSLNVPFPSTPVNPCVQVWQSDPARHGTRILCPDYKHNRYGIYAVAGLISVVFVVLLGIFIHHLTKTRAAGWLYIQKPVLLVCSSEQSAHVSAVCTLASILQEELSATVHMALCAKSSQREAGAGTGVADLGPLPWLYGQWEATRKAQGKVLIIWSPEAKKTYEKWREERANMDNNERKKEDDGKAKLREEEDLKQSGRRLGKCKKGKKDCVQLCSDDEELYNQNKPSTVITPVFTAALACLEGALRECKDQGVALVYFQGLGHSKDIPKAFKDVPQYCLPQDFRGLLQELGGMRRQKETGELRWHCWPKLLSKVLSIWLARQLTHRLQTLLPQVQRKKMQGLSVTWSQKTMSGKTQCRLKFPLAAKLAKPETVQEHEPLHGSAGREEQL